MHYDHTAIPDAELPQAVEPVFAHVVTTYASEVNKTVSMWRAIPDDRLDYKPHEKVNTIRTILVHQLLSERRFFGQFGRGIGRRLHNARHRNRYRRFNSHPGFRLWHRWFQAAPWPQPRWRAQQF